MPATTNEVRFLGLGPEEFRNILLSVAYVANGYARGADGTCAFCHGDPFAERSPPDSLIARFYKVKPRATTCPVCEGRPT